MNQTIADEFKAIGAMYDLLLPLSDGAKRRALAWLDDCFFGSDEQIVIIEDEIDAGTEYSDDDSTEYYEDDLEDEVFEDEGEQDIEEEPEGFQTFEQFYDAVNPKTVRQKVATAAWWLEDEQGKESWKTFDVSKMLKGIDQPVRYLSTTITQEKRKSDPMVEQLTKSGTSMQAHGTYKLTSIGRAFVEDKLAN